MNLFSAVKAGVTPLQAAERYGIRVSSGGKALCPFHEDHEPSLQIDSSHFYCFGCGAHGDVIDFTAGLFHLSAYEAATKLAQDFSLCSDRPPPGDNQQIQEAQMLKNHEHLCFFYLNAYAKLLQRYQKELAPKDPGDTIDERFAEACLWLCHVDYLLDQLLSGDAEERSSVVRMMLSENRLQKLQKKLKKTEGTNLMHRKPEEAWPSWYDGRKIDEILFCRRFLEEHPMKCIRGRLFTTDGMVEDEGEIQQMILREVMDCLTSGISKAVSGLFAALKLMAYSPPLPMETDRIHVSNGTYFLNGGFSEEKVFCNNRLKVAYRPDAPRPKLWLQFLSELLSEEDIPTLQEYLGYCLIPSTKGQKMLLLIGRGGEGKSRIGLVMRAILGDSMNTASIQKIENNRFSRADLENKLLMVDDDMDMNALPKTNYIKSIVTAEGKMDLERKGIQSYQSQLYARFLCFGNGTLQSLYDRSVGFFRRQIILTVKDRPEDRVDDPFLAEKMIAEAEGILLWMLEGLQRLRRNNFHFTLSPRAEENMAETMKDANNIPEFLSSEGYICFRADSEASTRDLYAAYKQWCEDNAYGSLSSRSFSNYLARHAEDYRLEATNNIHIGCGKRCRGYCGIEVSELFP